MQLQERTVGDVVVLTPAGRMTRDENFGALQHRVRDLVQEGRRKMVLDLASVSYMDSTCLGEIVSGFVTVRKNGGLLHLACPNPRVERLMAIAGLTAIFPTFPSEQAAVASMSGSLPEN